MCTWQKVSVMSALACLFSLSLLHAATPSQWMDKEQVSKAAVTKMGGGKVLLVSVVENSKPMYHVLGIDKGKRYDLDINAMNGDVVKFSKSDIYRAKLSPRGLVPAESRLSPDDVKGHALKVSGGGDIILIDRIYGKNGGNFYHFEIVKNDTLYSLSFDANTGALIQHEESRVDSVPMP